jgi:hypothetical protein
MKACYVPKEVLPPGFKGSRKIEIGMEDSHDIFERIYEEVDTNFMISDGAMVHEAGTRYYHISTVSCEGMAEKFLTTPCLCVKIIDDIVVGIAKHLPFKGGHEPSIFAPKGLKS